MVKKIDFKNYIGEGAVKMEEADGTRRCRCGNKILKGEKHTVIYSPNGRFQPKRYNFCRQCSVGLLIAESQRLFDIETKMFGQGGA